MGDSGGDSGVARTFGQERYIPVAFIPPQVCGVGGWHGFVFTNTSQIMNPEVPWTLCYKEASVCIKMIFLGEMGGGSVSSSLHTASIDDAI